MLKNYLINNMNIKLQHLAGFLNQALIKQVNKESWGQYDYERPLVKIKKSKVNRNSSWWFSFFRNSVEQLLP